MEYTRQNLSPSEMPRGINHVEALREHRVNTNSGGSQRRTKAQILDSFRDRLPRARTEEFSEAIRQVCRIMTFRLEDRVEETTEQRG